MAYLQSHQTLATHVKTKKAARKLSVSIPTMIGHLHLLWYWALDHAPDGDLSKFDDEDIADAACYEGDPSEFVTALLECGPGESAGFLDVDRFLHDWADYGGKYYKRVEAAKRAASARWDANAMRTHSEGNASGNAEERRGEEKRKKPSSPEGDKMEGFDKFWTEYPARNGKKLNKAKAQDQWKAKVKPDQREPAIIGARNYREAYEQGLPGVGAMDAFRFLRDTLWVEWQTPAEHSQKGKGGVVHKRSAGTCMMCHGSLERHSTEGCVIEYEAATGLHHPERHVIYG